MNFVLALIGGYIVGSLPTAFLLVRNRKGVDIRHAGSGNVGAFNAFEVTNSRLNGVLVGLVDTLKGFAVSGACAWVFKVSFEVQTIAFLGAVLGHNYPVWLRFKGGRGLATGAGGLFAIGTAYTLIWCCLWFVVYRIRKDIHTANVAAIIAAPLVLLAVPTRLVEATMVVSAPGRSYQLLGFVLSGILLVSHWDVVNKLSVHRREKHE
ncbi:MAG TPA: glycerol-3-phosphate acyltransferase [Bacteroidota bacterium]|nr:glycerol-3-phosphate acyltransferase [Bacteroidota bacterium]